MTDIKPVAWMTDDGRVVLTKTQEGMPSAAKISYNLPLYTESAILRAKEEGRLAGMREAAEIVATEICACCWEESAQEAANHIHEAITRASEGK